MKDTYKNQLIYTYERKSRGTYVSILHASVEVYFECIRLSKTEESRGKSNRTKSVSHFIHYYRLSVTSLAVTVYQSLYQLSPSISRFISYHR